MPSIEYLQELLSSVAKAPLECDGKSACISYLLKKEGIGHKAMRGSLTVDGRAIDLHFWIEITEGSLLIDYAARMWLGEGDKVPDGIMPLHDVKDLYRGSETVLMDINEGLFQILLTPIIIPKD